MPARYLYAKWRGRKRVHNARRLWLITFWAHTHALCHPRPFIRCWRQTCSRGTGTVALERESHAHSITLPLICREAARKETQDERRQGVWLSLGSATAFRRPQDKQRSVCARARVRGERVYKVPNFNTRRRQQVFLIPHSAAQGAGWPAECMDIVWHWRRGQSAAAVPRRGGGGAAAIGLRVVL